MANLDDNHAMDTSWYARLDNPLKGDRTMYELQEILRLLNIKEQKIVLEHEEPYIGDFQEGILRGNLVAIRYAIKVVRTILKEREEKNKLKKANDPMSHFSPGKNGKGGYTA